MHGVTPRAELTARRLQEAQSAVHLRRRSHPLVFNKDPSVASINPETLGIVQQEFPALALAYPADVRTSRAKYPCGQVCGLSTHGSRRRTQPRPRQTGFTKSGSGSFLSFGHGRGRVSGRKPDGIASVKTRLVPGGGNVAGGTPSPRGHNLQKLSPTESIKRCHFSKILIVMPIIICGCPAHYEWSSHNAHRAPHNVFVRSRLGRSTQMNPPRQATTHRPPCLYLVAHCLDTMTIKCVNNLPQSPPLFSHLL
ncbi:hypothetical protein Bbelb_385800 [Branchiostoma belcheri]|nr:hypothetical protein Bbelb_385800 [Branchiostoma belcheri]